MKSLAGTLAAPFPYFGGKSLACEAVWAALGDPENYVEPFAGSAAMLLGRPDIGKVETINDADGFVANFWRAVAHDAEAVADHADWPCNAGKGINRKLPHLGDAGKGISNKIPRLTGYGCTGITRATDLPRSQFIHDWFALLQARMRNVRVACGDWGRVVKDSVTTRHGLTGVFLDPPYTKGEMNYAAGGVGGALADEVRGWCIANGDNKALRIVLCGHAGEHDELLGHGWRLRAWTARKGYASTDEAVENSASETLWCSPHCVPELAMQPGLFEQLGLEAA